MSLASVNLQVAILLDLLVLNCAYIIIHDVESFQYSTPFFCRCTVKMKCSYLATCMCDPWGKLSDHLIS